MLSLSAKIRKETGKGVKKLRAKEILPCILYGPKIKNIPAEIDLKEFKKVFKEAGESSLIDFLIDGEKFLVLIHDVKKDPLTEEPIHVDFYQPILTEEVEVSVPLIFEGEAPAVKNLGGTLVKEIQEVQVKALPQNLPHEIKVNVESLETFEDEISIKDLKLSGGARIMREPDEIVANVVPPQKVEEELEKPVEEKLEGAEEAGEEKEAPTEGEESKEE